ncbi:16556_t:CDS:2 [Gigaspora margarita]|uniref:16556_t:CDS:1 n=1 Tax=Gigaspora margarita TaxID=4874 RepID=A0ABN7UQ85_GIGMA|nr:16556_t:CDS:2 [Gigaspora margarita]
MEKPKWEKCSNRVFYYKKENSSIIKKNNNNKRPLSKTEKFSKENLAKHTLTKKAGKTRNSIAFITDDRGDSSNRIELGKKRGKQNEQEIKLTQDKNFFKKDSILEQILNRLQKIEEKQGVPAPNYS